MSKQTPTLHLKPSCAPNPTHKSLIAKTVDYSTGRDRTAVSQTFTFCLRGPSVLLVLAVICWICWFHLRSAWSVMPRYFVEASFGLSSRGMEVVVLKNGCRTGGDGEGLEFVGIELHQPFPLPLTDTVVVLLKERTILAWSNPFSSVWYSHQRISWSCCIWPIVEGRWWTSETRWVQAQCPGVTGSPWDAAWLCAFNEPSLGAVGYEQCGLWCYSALPG